MGTKARWIIGGAIIAALVASCGWLVLTDAPAYQLLVRLYVDKRFLKHTLREWGVLAPVIFIGLQALQVVIAPIPGELTEILDGYLFGQWAGFFYSTMRPCRCTTTATAWSNGFEGTGCARLTALASEALNGDREVPD